MRCQTLADALRQQGAEIIFICRELPGNYCDWLEARNFSVLRLPSPATALGAHGHKETVPLSIEIDQCAKLLQSAGHIDWLIVDHYGIDISWERAMRAYCQKLMVIDDLANRAHDCDLLLDQNIQDSPDRYAKLVPSGCETLLGPKHALLRQEFAEGRAHQSERDGQVQRILVCMGGSDPENVTGIAVDALASLGHDDLRIDVVIGQANPNAAELEKLCAGKPGIRLHVQSSEIARLMAEADLMIGAAGSTIWERCCLGLPGIVVSIADNQRETCRQIAHKRAAYWLNTPSPVKSTDFALAVSSLLEHQGLLRKMSRRGMRLVDGRGVDRVSGALLGMATLITSASRKVPLVQAVRKAQEQYGVKGSRICVGDSDANCIARHFADTFWPMPLLRELTVGSLLKYCRSEGIRFIIPTRDGELSYFAAAKEQLAAHGISVMVSDADSIRLCLDKLEFARAVRAMGFPAIQTEPTIRDLDSDRFVVKERHGAGSLGIALNKSRDEATSHAKGLREPIFQPFIAGDEFSIDVYVNCKGLCMGAVTRRREVVTNGESQVTSTIRHPRLETACSALAEKLKLYGHAVFQAIEDNAGNIHIIECNPRFGGASTLSVHAGLASFLWFFSESSGGVVELHPFMRNTQQLRQVRYPCDALFPVE